ncbi:hypothetical protein FACS1894190_06130 [Spirochaetia bacterium]|nr:hypothetical protein FACS1894190_06130 [Spirochaetia bacterium]
MKTFGKKYLRYNISLVLLAGILAFAGCVDPINPEPEDYKNNAAGYGLLTITLGNTDTANDGDAGRSLSLFPASTGFKSYTISFSHESKSHAPVTFAPGDTIAVALDTDAAPWTVIVTAYTGTGGSGTAAAIGTAEVTMDGSAKTANIILAPVLGEGIFMYTIQFPTTVSSAVLTITKSDGGAVTGGTITASSGQISAGALDGALSLDAGYYLMNINLVKNTLGAGKTEVVHIYPGLITYAYYTFTDADLLPVLYGTVSVSGGSAYNPKVGETLTAGTTSLEGTTALSYQWKRGDTAGGTFTNILNRTGESYTLTTADKGKYIRVEVSRAGYSGSISSMVKLVAKYDISLSETGTYTFPSAIPGYEAQTAKSITITNTGNTPTLLLTTELSGANSGSFTLSRTLISGIAVGGIATFTVRPNTGLGLGTYTATVTVSDSNVDAQSFDISFTVANAITVENVITANSSATAAEVKAALTAYLASAPGGDSASNPVVVKINVTDLSQLTDGGDGIGVLFTANTGGKYVSYDLSGSSFTAISGSSSRTYSTKADKLVAITLPDSVTSIGQYAFLLCTGLTSITVDGGNSNYKSIDGVLFDKAGTILILYPVKKTGTSYTIPDSVTSIGNYAFQNCSNLESVTMGSGVISIDYYAFGNCTSLESVTIPDSVTSIGDSAFSYCTSLTSITIPNSVTSIGGSAFDWAGLTSVNIPDSVTTVGNGFEQCDALTSITVDSGNSYYKSIDGVLFNKTDTTLIRYPSAKTGSTYTIPNSVTSISGYAFSRCTSLTSVTIPDSVTSIDYSAFSGCYGLTSVTIPNSVTTIGTTAFRSCSLTSIIIPNSVTSIGIGAFEGTSLTSVTIGSGVTIADYAFPPDMTFYLPLTNALRTAYLAGGAGTYTRAEGGDIWTK